eukprot:CAMPEP_0176488996 /NCGR_PEP_ID=MMETSP0200_2-20121128/7033_1 /TAXON_ID=947934 /ORGANISM="Chaetoceros sp., Strain GSL56" /LENGTH=426 /DNA_ID=CAMNT_0017886069 /DNA_START=315 /DNA_END=1595 /DNA_ORIENTATION=+
MTSSTTTSTSTSSPTTGTSSSAAAAAAACSATAAAPPNRSLLQDGPCAFECPICFGIPLDPALTPKCEHIFCHSCITQALHHSKHCPTCRTPLTSTSSSYEDDSSLKRLERGTMLYRMWSHTPVQCRNSDVGCTWTGTVSEYQSHVGACDPSCCSCPALLDNDNNVAKEKMEEEENKAKGVENISCRQPTTKQQQKSQDSSSIMMMQQDGHDLGKISSALMASTREKTCHRWTRQLGVLERQHKNLEILLEQQRKMISRLRQEENEENLVHETTTRNDLATSHSPTTGSIMMSCCDAVQVTGAGIAQVNGIYKRTGSWDKVGMFTKKDVWGQDNVEQTFTLYRCNAYDNSKRWCISILPSMTNSVATVVDIDFYQQEASGIRDEVPGMLSRQWVCVRRGARGNGDGCMVQNEDKDCPPRVTYIPAV